MTREEAIKILQKLYEGCNKHKNTDLIKEAYNLAIEALKTQDVPDINVGNNSDTIYRHDAIDAMYKILHDYFWANDEELDAIIATLNDLPSAQPKPCEDAVSRQTLQKELALYPIDDVTSEDEAGYNRAINDVQKMVLHLPSAQSEIIRCRDCKYWREHKYAKNTKRYIPFCGFNAIYTKADDFCSRAERRTDAD